jgi:putative mRNA 3-end processing factor
LSDHADWEALIRTIEETKAKTILTTHGNASTLAKYLREEKHLDARELKGLDAHVEGDD